MSWCNEIHSIEPLFHFIYFLVLNIASAGVSERILSTLLNEMDGVADAGHVVCVVSLLGKVWLVVDQTLLVLKNRF